MATKQQTTKPPAGMADLRLENLHLVHNGEDVAEINRHIRACIQDCLERSADDRDRKVNIEVAIKPAVVKRGGKKEPLDGEFHVTIDSARKIPKSQSVVHAMRAHPSGAAYFRPESDHPDQTTIRDHLDADEDDVAGDD